jgi:SAM-dependent methyltransferase
MTSSLAHQLDSERKLLRTRLFAEVLWRDDLGALYRWFEECKDLFIPGSEAEGLIVQGVWDEWPAVSPARRQLELLVELVHPRPGQRVLDVGCGEGGVSRALLSACPELECVIGIDILPQHVERARARNSRRAEFYACDARRLAGVEDPALERHLQGGFDAICMMELCQDLTRPQFLPVLAECLELLRPGGALVMFALTIDKPLGSRLKKAIAPLLVRDGAAGLDDMLQVARELGLEVACRDLTSRTTSAMLARITQERELASCAFYWPFSSLFRYAARVYQQIIRDGAYHVTALRICKK